MKSIFLALAPLLPTSMFAQQFMVPELFPTNPSARDERFVIFRDSCGEVVLQPFVTLRRNAASGGWELETHSMPINVVCFATPAAFQSTVHAIKLPPELGFASLNVRLFSSDATLWFERTVGSQLWSIPPSITGTWHDPLNPGQGIGLTFSDGQGIVAHWATYGASGEPLWLVGAGLPPHLDRTPFIRRISLSSLRGGSFPGGGQREPADSPWGTADIEYLGCERLRLSWEAVDAVTFPSGSVELAQYSGEVTNPCDLIAFAFSRGLTLKVYVPVIAP